MGRSSSPTPVADAMNMDRDTLRVIVLITVCVTGFTKSLAREVANRGITVNTVAPGMIDTDMTKALNDDQRAAMLAQIPAGRLGRGEDVASAVLYLISEGAAYVTGETIHVNGGMLMM